MPFGMTYELYAVWPGLCCVAWPVLFGVDCAAWLMLVCMSDAVWHGLYAVWPGLCRLGWTALCRNGLSLMLCGMVLCGTCLMLCALAHDDWHG